MKKLTKIMALVLAMLMVVSFAACGGDKNNGENNETTVADETNAGAENNENNADLGEVIAPEVDDDTFGGILWTAFKAACAENSTANEMATAISTNENITFFPMVMDVEEGLLTGFDNNEITGFKSGAMFAPGMSSIAFVSYVFELDADADAAAFIDTLKAAANPRWNVCVEADQVVAGACGNFVFFAMCPISASEEVVD